ncbi:MAG: formylglycine-generating enzyme family protein [Candidatus Delongbacteria bacterium]|jgi:formylglycine-generating enzyme required for sulfatase activity|nr:formylglycine-generating enzyme family protein [Candidatus Delongbacteria bacterium]
MICKSCNTLNSNDAKKCVSCGEKLSSGSSKPDKKHAVQKPASKYSSKGTSAKKQKPVGEKKSGNLGKLFILLLIILAGAIYFLEFTSVGKEYIEGLKQNEKFGQYVVVADSLFNEFITNLDPKAKEEAERKRLEEEEKEKKAEAAKLAKKNPKKAKKKKFVIKRIKREMQYYTALKDNMNMVLIPADEVSIGSNVEGINESPIHKVYIKEFYIDEHEVTLQQFRIFVEETGYTLPDRIRSDRFNSPKQPIIGVSYEDAEAYAKWAGKRLPTEQEWEKAARGGLVGLKYPYNNTISPKEACYDLNPTVDGPFDVKSYGANDFKLYDFSGNVAEWTSSLPESYPGGKVEEEFGEEYRVIRGGSWKDLKSALTVSKREIKGKKWKGNNVGFRCVMDY